MNQGLFNLGGVSFAEDPYQVKVLRPILQQQGLWNPAWDEWANFQASGDDTASAPATPDFSSLAGHQAAFGDSGGGNRMEGLVGAGGETVAANPYFYDEPSMGESLVQGLGIVGGAALGMNALFGGLGSAAGAAGASDGLMLAGQYGAPGALGDASLLTGSSLGTVAQPAAGLTFGGSALGGGLSAANAGLTGGGTPAAMAESTLTPMDVPSVPSTPEIATPTATLDPSGALPAASTGGGLLEYLQANPRLVAGLAGGLLGGAEAGGGGSSYNGPMPTITRGGWSPTATPTYAQPQAQQPMNVQQGQANSGLWRYMLGGGQ